MVKILATGACKIVRVYSRDELVAVIKSLDYEQVFLEMSVVIRCGSFEIIYTDKNSDYMEEKILACGGNKMAIKRILPYELAFNKKLTRQANAIKRLSLKSFQNLIKRRY